MISLKENNIRITKRIIETNEVKEVDVTEELEKIIKQIRVIYYKTHGDKRFEL